MYSSISFYPFIVFILYTNMCFLFLYGVLMLKGLMDRCTSHKTVISCLREKVEARDSKLRELTAWKEVQINKLDYTRKLLEESEASVEALKEILKDNE